MIDLFSLAVSHGLIMLAVWRLVTVGGLEGDDAASRTPMGPRKDA